MTLPRGTSQLRVHLPPLMKTSRRLLFALLVAAWSPYHLALSADEFRDWKDSSGRKVEAAFAGMDGNNVRLRLRNGSVIPYPLEKLSSADQDWTKAQGGGSTASAAAGNSKGETLVWPRSTGLDEAPNATVVKEDAETAQFIYRTNNFEFRCDARLGKDVVREFGRIFEGTLKANKELPLGLDPRPEDGREYFVAQLYSSHDDYLADGGVKGSAGIYSGSDNSVKVPLPSLGVRLAGKHYAIEPRTDNDTLIHEITHQMMNHWLGKLPEWYIEGAAMYVASSRYNMGRLTMPRLGQTVKRLEWLRPGGETLWHMDYLMHITPAQWHEGFGDDPDGNAGRNYSSAIALTYYFYHGDDKGDAAHMISLLKDVRAGKKWKEAQDEHLIRGRDYAQIEKEVAATLRKGGITVEFVDAPSKMSATK